MIQLINFIILTQLHKLLADNYIKMNILSRKYGMRTLLVGKLFEVN